MTFIWPAILFLLLLVPLILLVYWQFQRRRRSLEIRLGNFGNQKPTRAGFRRHVPFGLFLLSLAILLLALARPQAEINLPRVEGTVLLVFDVSGSMAAKDVEPTRMEAAKAAAREFVLSQPQTIRIGIVSFSGVGFAVQPPSNDTQNLLAAINRLKPQTGTSLGQGILVALHTIAVDAGLVSEKQNAIATPGVAQSTQQPGMPQQDILAQLPEGSYPSAVIVLLSDGENNQSIDPLKAAQAATEHNVRIDALGFGTTEGIILEVNGFSVHTALDEALLQQITAAANGTYYNPSNEPDPQTIYKNLTPQLVIKSEKIEITSIFAGVSILFLLLGAGASLLWFNRLV
jgi:Ca-activated chloride channel family protein